MCDQILSIDLKCFAIKIIADQCLSILIYIDRQWSAMIFIEKHWYQCLEFDCTLIHIDQHCTLIHHVLIYVRLWQVGITLAQYTNIISLGYNYFEPRESQHIWSSYIKGCSVRWTVTFQIRSITLKVKGQRSKVKGKRSKVS